MAANWRLLTDYLAAAGDDVRLAWSEFDAVVGGLPASAIDHYPQWWHGDRPNARAWRAAGYEAIEVRPGVSVRFVRSHRPLGATVMMTPRRAAHSAANPRVASPSILDELDSLRCLIAIPARPRSVKADNPVLTSLNPLLNAARRRVLEMPDSRTDESLLMPAWQR